MKQYVDKEAIIAELERIMNKQQEICKEDVAHGKKYPDPKNIEIIYQFQQFVKFINTLEVKEVNLEHLEQAVKDFCYEYDDRKEKWYELCANDKKLLYNPTWANFAMSIAKHFFELGLKVKQG